MGGGGGGVGGGGGGEVGINAGLSFWIRIQSERPDVRTLGRSVVLTSALGLNDFIVYI